jgi:hypothetical protein
MSTHRVPIQTLRPPKGTGPEVRCHPGVLVKNRSSCTAPGSARFAPGAHLPCRGLSILVFDANTTEHPGLSPGMLFHVIGLRVIPFPRYYHFCTICLSKTSEPHVLCEPTRRGKGEGGEGGEGERTASLLGSGLPIHPVCVREQEACGRYWEITGSGFRTRVLCCISDHRTWSSSRLFGLGLSGLCCSSPLPVLCCSVAVCLVWLWLPVLCGGCVSCVSCVSVWLWGCVVWQK